MLLFHPGLRFPAGRVALRGEGKREPCESPQVGIVMEHDTGPGRTVNVLH